MFLSYCQIWVQEVQKVQWVQVRPIRPIRSIRVRIETSRGQNGLSHVYRLGEDGNLKNEGNGMLSFWALRARSYKTRAEA